MKNYDDIIMFTNKYRSEPSLVTMNHRKPLANT